MLRARRRGPAADAGGRSIRETSADDAAVLLGYADRVVIVPGYGLAVAQAYGVFNEAIGAANRGTFLVDRAGVVRFAEMNGPGEARDQDVWRKALSAL